MDMKIVQSLADHLVKSDHTARDLGRYLTVMDTDPAYVMATGIDKGITVEEMRHAFRMAIEIKEGEKS